MSKKTRLKAEMREASARARGSHLTQQARRYFIGMFVTSLFRLGFPLQRISQIGVRAVVAFVASRASRSIRTKQNDMTHLRTILRHAGREQFARDRTISNKALGISGGSRRGAKKAIPDTAIKGLLARITDAGLRAILLLERELGLRAKEAILSVRSLKSWHAALLAGKSEVHVIFGTKGGRPRWARILDRDSTLAAIVAALKVVEERGKLAPKSNLNAALRWYSNSMFRLGVQGHALRYAYAQRCIQACLAEGYSLAEALAITAMSLGHGDGRARMVKSVYGQEWSSEKRSVSKSIP